MLKISDCKQMLSYYHIKTPATIKDIKSSAINLLVNKLCKCYCEKKIQRLIYRKFYNSRNNKNLNNTRRIRL